MMNSISSCQSTQGSSAMETTKGDHKSPGQDRDRRDLNTPANDGAVFTRVVAHSFDLMKSREYRDFIFSAACDAIADPSKVTYGLAVLIVGTDRKTQHRDAVLFGDITDLVVQEARQRLINKPTEVLDELMERKWD